ncbi:MAG: DEAD/DEAH box helicase family protein [Rhodocyclaceae bacterium]|nr:DEAD/DEAH box helicase family protein [Rhodocyclaceae bacterium]
MGIMGGISLDDAGGSSALANLRLLRELAQIKIGLKEGGSGPLAAMKRLKLVARANQIRVALGATAAPKAAPAPSTQADSLALYPSGEERLTPARRQKDNDAAIALLETIQSRGPGQEVTEAERAVLAKYTGNGGNLVGASGRKGSPYEYYTPKPIASAAWGVLAELGFSGGKVLDPCAGTGIFGATKPAGATVDAVELSPISGAINQALNGNCTVAPFEEVASRTPEEVYDAVITNVPFGDAAMRGGNALKDPLYQSEDLEGYFLMRTMGKLKPGGLAAYICPPRVVSGLGKKEQNVRYQMSLMGEFIGAYRLPNSVFQLATEADTITDLVVFRKHTHEQKAQIDACMDSGKSDVLREASVLWGDFIEGQYFKGEGRRFQFGEFVAKDPSKFRDVDRVVAADGGKPADVAKLMTKLGSGRIDWPAVDAVPAIPAETNDGDAIYDGGAISILKNGRVVRKEGASDEYGAELLAKLSSPVDAVLNAVSHAQAKELLAIYGDRAPEWLRVVEAGIGATMDSATYAGTISPFWGVIAAALAAEEVIKLRGAGFNYLAGFPEISAAIQEHASRVIAARETVSGMPRLVNALERIPSLYAGKEFSPMWKGEDVAPAEKIEYTAAQRFDALRYAKGDERGAVPMEDWKAIYAIDPFDSDHWCVTADGKVISANDYYTGTYGALMESLKAELDTATDERIRAKIIRQMNRATALVNIPDFDKLNYDLQSPFVSQHVKLQFLRENLSGRFELKTSGAGKLLFQVDGNGREQSVRALKRMAVWLNTGTITAGMSSQAIEEDPEEYRQLMAAIKELVARGNAGFDVWMKSSGKTKALKAEFNLSSAGFVGIEEDASAVKIDGFNMRLNGVDIEFRDYQNQAIRQYTRNLSGICALDVGLGKTLTALAAVKHIHNVGAKKRTIFAVPKSVLANWQREAMSLYQDTGDCLFVGVRDGQTNAKFFNEDLAKIPSGRYAKIFMSIDTLVSIPIKEQTIEGFLAYIQEADTSYLSIEDDGTEKSYVAGQARIAKEIAALAKGRADAPFFEDMGVDSIVIDEAHVMKNGKVARGFSNVKFMSMPEKSLRAMNTGVKAWFVRNGSVKNDGVLLLTATPITNSPLEIYSMLALAAGDSKVNASLGGLRSASDFVSAYADIATRAEDSITGGLTALEVPVFDGLKNVPDLCRNLRGVALIKTAAESGLPLPETVEQAVSVQIDAALLQDINNDKARFKRAMAALLSGEKDRTTVMIASPFNLIDKMSRGVLDRDVYDNVTRYVVKDPALADAGVAKFNGLAMIDKKRSHNSYLTLAENVVVTYDLKAGDDDGTGRSSKPPVVPYVGDIGGYAFDVKVIGVRPDNEKDIVAAFDTINPVVQERAIKVLGEQNLDVSVSPKIAALIENVKKEIANPVAGSGGKAKQIIFCDMLGAHSKIRLALTTKAGVPSSQIAIISGAATPEPEDVQEVSDGFNGMDDDNRYTIIIANKKAEVGINLQKGTQAVHHLTTGWTPDSLHQRNGRAIRQGNKAERVTVYQYDAEGSFDSYKRNLLGRKADWIQSVMTGNNGEDRVKIGGALTKKDLEEMVERFGDAEATRKFNAERAERDRERNAAEARARQVALLRTINIPQKFLNKYPSAEAYVRHFVVDGVNATIAEMTALERDLGALKASFEKIANQKSESAVRNQGRLQRRIAEAEAAIAKKQDIVNATNSAIAQFAAEGEESALHKEWQEAHQRNQSALDQTKVEFGRIKGGFDASVIDDYLDGNGAIVNGELVSAGMIATTEDESLFVITKSHNQRGVMMAVDANRMSRQVSSLSGAKYFSAGHPKWEVLLKRVADMDAEWIRAGGEAFFSSFVPAAAQFLPDDLPVQGSWRGDTRILLKAPAFPVPLQRDAYSNPGFFAVAAASQDGMFARTDYNSFWVQKEFAVIRETPLSRVEKAQCAIDFARQKSIKADWASLVKLGVESQVFGIAAGIEPAALRDALASRAFSDEADVDAYIKPFFDKAGEVISDVEPGVIFSVHSAVAEAKKRAALAQYGENIVDLSDYTALVNAQAAMDMIGVLRADMAANTAAKYVSASSSGQRVDVDHALAVLGAKKITYKGSDAVLFQKAGGGIIFMAAVLASDIASMNAYKVAAKAAAEAKIPPELQEKMNRLRAVSGVDQVGLVETAFTAQQYGGKTVHHEAYGAVFVVTPFGGKASKRIQGAGFHFEKYERSIPKAWVVSVARGPNKKTVDDLLVQLGA